jgi:glycosyltransferase involved in cell wall biosynthesis
MADAAVAAAADGATVYFITAVPVRPFYSGAGREKMADIVKGFNNLKVISCGVNYLYEFGSEKYRANILAGLITGHVPRGTPLIVSDDSAVWAAAASVSDKYRMVGVIHGNDDIYYSNARKYAGQLTACVCVSNRIKDNLLRNCPEVNVAKVTVIPCGINLPGFAPLSGAAGKLRLIFIGRIEDKVKRATDLVFIAALMYKQGISFHLNIIGNSEKSGIEFFNSFRNAGIERFVTLCGWLSKNEIQALLNESDVLLLTSDSEGMPLVMMEALASGCAFTGTRVSGIEDYEFHPLAGNCVSVYSVGDIEDAVNKIKNVGRIPENIRTQAARKLAVSEFSMDTCLGKYFNIIFENKSSLPPASINMGFSGLLSSRAIAMARYLKVRIINRDKKR